MLVSRFVTHMAVDNASFADALHHVGRPSPRVFGGPVWNFLESVALALPDTLKQEEQAYLKNWLLKVAQCMPCAKCGKDFERRIHAMNNRLQSRGNVLASFIIFQREIQQQHGGRVKSFEEHYDKIVNVGHGFARKISTQPSFTNAVKKAHSTSREPWKRGTTLHSIPAVFAQLQVHQKEQWGPYGWLFLYYIMMGLPDRPNNLQVQEFLESTFSMLPCESCTQHALKYLKSHSPSDVPLRTRGEWIAFVSNMHNAVNKRLGKRCLTEAERLAILEQLPRNNYVFFHAPEEKKKKEPDESAYVNHKDSGITIVLVLVSITGLFGLVALSTNALLRR